MEQPTARKQSRLVSLMCSIFIYSQWFPASLGYHTRIGLCVGSMGDSVINIYSLSPMTSRDSARRTLKTTQPHRVGLLALI